MTCFLCKGDMKVEYVPYTLDMEEYIVVIRKVPANICEKCGTMWYSGTVAKKLEEIMDAIKSNGVKAVNIVNYPGQVA